MIDWSVLVRDSLPNLPKNEAKSPCSDSTYRNKPPNTQTVGTLETLSSTGFQGFVPTVPAVPTGFERTRIEKSENNKPLSFIGPAGGEFEEQCAPHKKAIEPYCRTCADLCRPGLSDGYCGAGREDLAHAYGHGHPLRKLPADGGENCPVWTLHPFL